MATTSLTVLVHEGPMARAYLSGLCHVGFRPSRVLKLVYRNHPVTHRPLGRWLGGRFREKYAETIQDQAFFFWPRQLRRKYPDWIARIATSVSQSTGFPENLILEADGSRPLGEYAGSVDRVFIDGFKDQSLRKKLSEFAPGTILFTGGGLVPKSILSIPELRFLHVHPGVVPDIKGADGLLWSSLLRGNPGTSCFYMAPELDGGDVIATREFAPLSLPSADVDDDTLYRAIFSFCDPFLRAAFFNEIVSSVGGSLDGLKSHPQDPDVGLTYHFMHHKLRNRVLKMIFSS